MKPESCSSFARLDSSHAARLVVLSRELFAGAFSMSSSETSEQSGALGALDRLFIDHEIATRLGVCLPADAVAHAETLDDLYRAYVIAAVSANLDDFVTAK